MDEHDIKKGNSPSMNSQIFTVLSEPAVANFGRGTSFSLSSAFKKLFFFIKTNPRRYYSLKQKGQKKCNLLLHGELELRLVYPIHYQLQTHKNKKQSNLFHTKYIYFHLSNKKGALSHIHLGPMKLHLQNPNVHNLRLLAIHLLLFPSIFSPRDWQYS